MVVVVGLVLVLLIVFIYHKVTSPPPGPGDVVVPPGTTEEEIKNMIYIGDIPRNTVLKAYMLVWDKQDKEHPARLPPGTIITGNGGIIPPGRLMVYPDEMEKIRLSRDKPSDIICSGLKRDGFTLIAPEGDRDYWLARRPCLYEFRYYGNPKA